MVEDKQGSEVEKQFRGKKAGLGPEREGSRGRRASSATGPSTGRKSLGWANSNRAATQTLEADKPPLQWHFLGIF